jgi:excisionase family DNA binding protein
MSRETLTEFDQEALQVLRELRTELVAAARNPGPVQSNQVHELLTSAEVAARLRLSRRTIWRWCRSGQLPAAKVGHQWRVAQRDLEDFIRRYGKL